MLKKKSRGGSLMLRSLWIITSYENNCMELLTVDPDTPTEGSLLPVFSFEEEAQTFLGLLEDEQKGWSIRQTTPGELISILLAPCADVRQVLLDPLPLPLGRVMLPYVSESRERFIEKMMEERRQWTRELVPE
jgi:hypothetical protein